jgi:hypothetical protein
MDNSYVFLEVIRFDYPPLFPHPRKYPQQRANRPIAIHIIMRDFESFTWFHSLNSFTRLGFKRGKSTLMGIDFLIPFGWLSFHSFPPYCFSAPVWVVGHTFVGGYGEYATHGGGGLSLTSIQPLPKHP